MAQSDFDLRFGGIARLYSKAGLDKLRRSHVCIIGVGGVGSWTVEALARSGLGKLTLVDLDEVCVTNINRQLPALTPYLGEPKVDVLAHRVRAINPDCEILAHPIFYTPESADPILQSNPDFVVDAIDGATHKCHLIAACRDRNIPIIVSGSAGGRRDPTQIRTADLAKTTHDRLLTRVRKTLREEYNFPENPKNLFGIDAVFSPEPLVFPQQDGTVCAVREEGSDLRLNCESGYGTASFLTGTFGFCAAAYVVRKLTDSIVAQKDA